jgi:hypothetical protein
MSHTDSNRRKPAAAGAVVLVLLLACLGLVACGGSSSSSSSATTATTSASTGTGAKGPNAGRFAAIRECLQKNGITLPKRTPGQKRPYGGAGGFLGGGAGGSGAAGGPQLPKGVTRSQYEAALKKCGGGAFAGRGGARFKSPAFQAALAKFATCMRENGVNVPAPNTSGSGPVFDTKGIDTTSAQFKAAEAKCRSDLTGAFRRGGGAGGSPSASGAPPGAAPPSSGEAPGGAAGPPAG